MQQHSSAPVPLSRSFIKDRSKASGLPMKSKKASSFHEFARSTSDAWDIGDDEDEEFSSSSSSSSLQTLNSKVAKATAAQVLENHSKLRVKPERCQPALSDLPTNCKVIKSSSEAQLSRTSGKSHLQEQLPAPVLSYLATELNCSLVLTVWARGCDTAHEHNTGLFFLLVLQGAIFGGLALKLVSSAAQYPAYRHVCPSVFHVLGAKSVLGSVKFLVGLAHCLLPRWLGVLLLAKVWVRSC